MPISYINSTSIANTASLIANNSIVGSMIANNTITSTQLANGQSLIFNTIVETTNVSATAANGTINFDCSTQPIVYYTSNTANNWTINFRGTSSIALNNVMSIGQTTTITFISTQGANAYFSNTITVDGVSVTPKWQGGIAPTAGSSNSIDAYTYAIFKTGNAAFTVLASQTRYS